MTAVLLNALLWANAVVGGVTLVLLVLQRRVALQPRQGYLLWRFVLAAGVLVVLLAVITSALSTSIRGRAGESLVRKPSEMAVSMPLPQVSKPTVTIRARFWDVGEACVTMWAIGLVIGLFQIGRNVILMHRLRARADAATPGLKEACRALIEDNDIRVSRDITTPIVIGYLRPCIVFPSSLESILSQAALHQVALHELVHLRGRDNVSILVEQLAGALFWCNPAIRKIRAEIGFYRERRCDEIASKSAPTQYMRSLLVIMQYMQSTVGTTLASAAADSPSVLLRRIHAIASPQEPQQVPLVAVAAIAAIAAWCSFIASSMAPAIVWTMPAHLSARSMGSRSHLAAVLNGFIGTWTCYSESGPRRVIGVATFAAIPDGLLERNESVGGTWTYRSRSIWRLQETRIHVEGRSNVSGRTYETDSTGTPTEQTVAFSAWGYRNTLSMTANDEFRSITSLQSHGRWATIEDAICDRTERTALMMLRRN